MSTRGVGFCAGKISQTHMWQLALTLKTLQKWFQLILGSFSVCGGIKISWCTALHVR